MAKSAAAAPRTVVALVPGAECMPLPCRVGHVTHKRRPADFTRAWAIRGTLSEFDYNAAPLDRCAATPLPRCSCSLKVDAPRLREPIGPTLHRRGGPAQRARGRPARQP